MLSKGFSKSEIILVAVILVIVVGIDFFVVSYLKNKEEDVQKITEISQIRSALDLYYFTNNYYPEFKDVAALNDDYLGTQKLCVEGFEKYNEACSKTILNPIPNQYYSSGNRYLYQSTEENKNYQLEFILKTNFKTLGFSKGKICVTNTQIVSQPCF